MTLCVHTFLLLDHVWYASLKPNSPPSVRGLIALK
jgi:hypothetical protein